MEPQSAGTIVGKAPYGYRNVRKDDRCVTEVDAAAAETVRRIFHLYAYEPLTLDALRDRLHADGTTYRPDSLRFTRSKLHAMPSQTRDTQSDALAQREELLRQSSLLVAQQDRLLNLRLWDEVDQDTFTQKHTELRDQLSSIKLQLDVLDRSHDETAELAAKVFELSQTLQNTWVSADYATKRRILEIVCLNCTLDGASLVPTTRKPFDVLIEGLYSEQSRGGGI